MYKDKSKKTEHIDIFTKITRQIENFIVKYLKVILITISVFVVALAIYFLIEHIYSKREEYADKSFGKVYLVYKNVKSESGDKITEEEKTKKLSDLTNDFKIVINDYPNSIAAMKSAYFIGNILFDSGKYKEALEYYKKGYSKKGKTNYISMLCLLNEATCYEQLEDYDKAAQVYERILSDFSDEYIVPYALYNLGQIQEKQNKFQSASDKYSKIVSGYDWSSWKQFAEKKLLLIKNFQHQNKLN